MVVLKKTARFGLFLLADFLVLSPVLADCLFR